MLNQVISELIQTSQNAKQIIVVSPRSTVKLIEANADLFRAIKKFRELGEIEKESNLTLENK